VFFGIRDGNGSFSTSAASANTGSGVLGAGSLVDPTAWDQDQYTVRFIDQNNYEVLDSSAAVVTTGTFEPGDTLAFSGIEFRLDGQPQGGDEFFAVPSQFQDVFSTLDQVATAVELSVNDDVSRAALHNGVNSGLLNIDQAIGNLLDVRTQVGSRLSAIESQVDSNASFSLNYQETLASLEDLDYAEAISRLSMEVTTLEAAQQSFVRTQSLSLFNYF
jgi:flagellar hook-associated protein 3 FlgL